MRVATRRVFLIESLDAAGAAPIDAQSRASAIECSGARVQAVVIEPERASDPGFGSPVDAGRIPRVRAGQDGFAAVRTVICETRPDLVVVASAQPGGGASSSAVPPGVRAAWWPSGLTVAAAPRASGWFGSARPLLAPLQSGRREDMALDWAVVAPAPPARGRLTLWDGDYVVVPMMPGPESALEIFDAFALASADGHSHDLVVLCDPDSRLEGIARRLGIGTRVHFAGASPREAECAWLSFASLAVIAGPGPLSAGLPLRTLMHGCPVHVAGNDSVSGALRHWLAERHALASTGTTIEAFAAVLEREDSPREPESARRTWTRAFSPEAIGVRLVACWGDDPPVREAA
jgi:hypothetical protein